MRKNVSIMVFALLVSNACSNSVFASDNEKDTKEIMATGTSATPIKHEPPTYPMRALVDGNGHCGIEGWIELSFMVRKDGTTDDITVLNASSEYYFKSAAIDAVSAWVYAPATKNGEPVKECKRVRQLFACTERQLGVTKSFERRFNEATKSMEEGDFKKAKRLIKGLDSSKQRLLSEIFYLDVLKTTYYSKLDDKKAARRYLERALVIADKVATEKMHVTLLKQAVVENARAGNYRTAVEHFSTLTEVDKDVPADAPLSNLVERIKQTVDGDGALIAEGNIPQCDDCDSSSGIWWHGLIRNRFTIDQIDGEVDELKVLCGNHSVSFTYKPDFEWSVDSGWGECDLYVSGNRDTSFRLIELPKVSSE